MTLPAAEAIGIALVVAGAGVALWVAAGRPRWGPALGVPRNTTPESP